MVVVDREQYPKGTITSGDMMQKTGRAMSAQGRGSRIYTEPLRISTRELRVYTEPFFRKERSCQGEKRMFDFISAPT